MEYDFAHPKTISSASVYWYDDSGSGQCRVPKSWRLTYQQNGEWVPVPGASSYGTMPDKYNAVSFAPVTASAFRVEAQLQPGFSGGILRWRLG